MGVGPGLCRILYADFREHPSVLKNPLVLVSDPRSRALNPGFVVFWAGFEVFCGCSRLPIGPTTTFSTTWGLLGSPHPESCIASVLTGQKRLINPVRDRSAT